MPSFWTRRNRTTTEVETPVKLKELTEVKRDLLIALFNNYNQYAREGIEARRLGALAMIKKQLEKFSPKELMSALQELNHEGKSLILSSVLQLDDLETFEIVLKNLPKDERVTFLSEQKLLQSAVEKKDADMMDTILAHLTCQQRTELLRSIVTDYGNNVENDQILISEQSIHECIALLEAGIDNSNESTAVPAHILTGGARREQFRRQHSDRFLKRKTSEPLLQLNECVRSGDYSKANQSLTAALLGALDMKTRPLDDEGFRAYIGRLLFALNILQQSYSQEQFNVLGDAVAPTIAI